MKAVLDGRFILHEYVGSMGGKPFDGVAIYGFDLATNKFQAAWIDSFYMLVRWNGEYCYGQRRN